MAIKTKLQDVVNVAKETPEESHAHWQNLSRRHQKALSILRRDKSITIKQADKGSCIVIMDTKEYLREGLEHLSDKETYLELEEDPSKDTAEKANELISKHRASGLISKHTADSHTMQLENVRSQRMYFLRKVHKNPHQLRPIVSCNSGPTEKISKLANNILKDYLRNVPALVTSTTQVIHAIKQLKIPEDNKKILTLATLDVKALYPSIPHGTGIAFALQQAIPTHPPSSKTHPLKTMLREMLTLILQGNTFEFAAKHFKQVKGVAMGTPVAPTLANLFMGKVEKDALLSWTRTQPIVWLRFIDDILVILEDTPEILEALVSHLNKQVSSIKFTSEYSQNSIDFLNLKGPRYEKTGILDIRPYSKAIDPHAYLHFSSAHHKSIIRGMVKGEMIRVLRRSSSPEIFAQGMRDLEQWFLDRGYRKLLLREIAATIHFSDRQGYLTHKANRALPDCTTILSVKNHPALKSSDIYKLLDDPCLPFQPLVTRRKPASIADLVVRAETPSEQASHHYHLRRRM